MCFYRLWTNRRILLSIPVAEYASFPHQARALKTNLLGSISNLSKNITVKQAQFASFSYLHMYLPI